MNPVWRQSNLICTFDGTKVGVEKIPLPVMRKDLFELFDIHELEKYMTPEEIAMGGIN
jgi:succinate dehydrogenase / fumarate reductase flavoprotein subunit